MRNKRAFMIVVGGSAGGFNAACQLLGQLKREVNAAIAIILHLPERGDTPVFVARLQKCTTLPCQVAGNGMAFKSGHVYLAPAGHHLLIGKKLFQLGQGPAESGWRPSVDTTFRSAAAAWDSHCIGVVVSGLLSDGTAGMEAIKRCGGLTFVQDPTEAEYPNMPRSVVQAMEVDECIRVGDMGKSLAAAVKKNRDAVDVPPDVLVETKMAERASTGVDAMAPFNRSVYSCPECGGMLWEIEGGEVKRFRCHIGHGFTEPELLLAQEREIENTLWVALRALEEKRTLLEKMASREQRQGFGTLAEGHSAGANDLKTHIGRMKELIFSIQNNTAD